MTEIGISSKRGLVFFFKECWETETFRNTKKLSHRSSVIFGIVIQVLDCFCYAI